jgi:hypothetical protein
VITPDDFEGIGRGRPFSGWFRDIHFEVGEVVDVNGVTVPALVWNGRGTIYNLDAEAPDLLESFADLGDGLFKEGRIRPDLGRLTYVQIQRVRLFAMRCGPPWLSDWEHSQTPDDYPSIPQVIEEARRLRLCMEIAKAWPNAEPLWLEIEDRPIGMTPPVGPDEFVGWETTKHLYDVALSPWLPTRPGGRSITAFYMYRSLLGAIWLRFFESLTGIVQKRCRFRNCGALLNTTEQTSVTGRRKRQDQQYCDTYCADAERQAAARERRRQNARSRQKKG